MDDNFVNNTERNQSHSYIKKEVWNSNDKIENSQKINKQSNVVIKIFIKCVCEMKNFDLRTSNLRFRQNTTQQLREITAT